MALPNEVGFVLLDLLLPPGDTDLLLGDGVFPAADRLQVLWEDLLVSPELLPFTREVSSFRPGAILQAPLLITEALAFNLKCFQFSQGYHLRLCFHLAKSV